jgi:N-formylglutamate deformylase
MQAVRVTRGDGPVILAMPHAGTLLPDDIRARLNDRGRKLTDTDWHIDRLYSGLLPGATVVQATFHRYVIDANRPPDGTSLYPGQNTTGLVPLTDFDGHPIWDAPPSAADIAARIRDHHAPYHTALAAEIARLRAIHGTVLLWDCHSIRSVIPFLFDGLLPDFNIGSANCTSCAPEIAQIALEGCQAAPDFTSVLNGRFKGGWTTRHYGRPRDGVHAIQMELAQATHLVTEAPPFAYDAARAARLRPILAAILARLAAVLPSLKVTP